MTVLILAGTAEARKLAARLTEAGVDVVASLAGVTDDPAQIAASVWRGGFGSGPAFAEALRQEGVRAIVDATHPFAEAITARSAAVARAVRVPFAIYQRPPWVPKAGDNWHGFREYRDLSALIPAGARVFAAVGKGGIAKLANFTQYRFVGRQIGEAPMPLPPAFEAIISARPPFTRSEEFSLLWEHKIDWVVCKNSGGEEGRAKLDAAREAGVPVAMMARPSLPDAPLMRTEEEVLAWLRQVI